jgi:NAD-dependent deacetylase
VITLVEEARRELTAARFVLVLTGAGMSAESGVPTFRGEGGYWRNRHFSTLANAQTFAHEPQLVWEWYLERRRTVRACAPNPGHVALAAWAQHRGHDGTRLVTQNVDGLHERSGHPEVVRFHGSLWRNRCTACGREREDHSLQFEGPPLSPCCRALERPGVVWFGEAIPTYALEAAFEAAAKADGVLVIGTTGIVYPAAAVVEQARDAGATVVEVNPDEEYGTSGEGVFGGLWLRAKAGDVLPGLLALDSAKS